MSKQRTEGSKQKRSNSLTNAFTNSSFWDAVTRKHSQNVEYIPKKRKLQRIASKKQSQKNLMSLKKNIVEFQDRTQELLEQHKSCYKLFQNLSKKIVSSEKGYLQQMMGDGSKYNTFQTLDLYLEKLLIEKYLAFKTDPLWKEIQKKDTSKKGLGKRESKIPFYNLEIPEKEFNGFKKYLENAGLTFEVELALEISQYNQMLKPIISKDQALLKSLLHVQVTCSGFEGVFDEFEFLKNPKVVFDKLSIIDEIVEEIMENLEIIDSEGKEDFMNFGTSMTTTDMTDNNSNSDQRTFGSISVELEKMITEELKFIRTDEKKKISPTTNISSDDLLNEKDDVAVMFSLVKKGKLEEFKEKIKSVEGWETLKDKKKRSFLHYASIVGGDILQFLLDSELNVQAQDKDFRTPLFFACMSEKRENVMFLLGNQAKVNVKDSYGISPLQVCLEKHCFELAEDLLLFNADINFKRENGSTYLHESIIKQDFESFEWLLSKDPKLNIKDSSEASPLVRSIAGNDPEFFSKLLEIKAVKFDDVDFKGKNIIHIICIRQRIEHLKVFAKMDDKNLHRFSKIFKEKLKGNTCLHIAVEQRNFKFVKILVMILKRLHIEMDSLNDVKETPLMTANRISSEYIENYLQNTKQETKQMNQVIKIGQLLQEVSSRNELSTVLVDDNSKVSNLFNNLTINSGQTIAELSKKHRVIIFTIKWFGCPLCQELIDLIGKSLFTMLKMNTIPVIGHQQNHESAVKYFQSNKDPISKTLPFCRIGKEEREILGLTNSPLSEHMKTMKKNLSAVIYDNRFFSAPTDVVSPLTAFGVFSIENNKITKKLIYKDFTKKLNFGKILQEGMTEYQYQDDEEDEDDKKEEKKFNQIFELFKDLDIQKLKEETAKKQETSIFKKDKEDIEFEKLEKEMNEVLYDDAKRYYFRVFTTNEFVSETLMFYEEVLIYKSIPSEQFKKRKKIFEKIYHNFISDAGISQIIISNKNVTPISTILLEGKKDSFKDEVFDDVIVELKKNLMVDLFSRYKESSLYEESKSKNTTVTYFM
eukprot:gene3970-7226_t